MEVSKPPSSRATVLACLGGVTESVVGSDSWPEDLSCVVAFGATATPLDSGTAKPSITLFGSLHDEHVTFGEMDRPMTCAAKYQRCEITETPSPDH